MTLEELRAKAVEIRRERINKAEDYWQELLNTAVKKAYNWILDIIQKDNKKKCVILSKEFYFYMHYNGVFEYDNAKLDMGSFISLAEDIIKHERNEFFEQLQKVVQSVDGYIVGVTYDYVDFNGSTVTLFKVTIV